MSEYVLYSTKETRLNEGEPMFWSNENGWGSLDDATIFAGFEVEKDDPFLIANPHAIYLPLDGIMGIPLQITFKLPVSSLREGLEQGFIAWDEAAGAYRLDEKAEKALGLMLMLGALALPQEDQ